ncbi:uncharacterized protein FPOAC1_013488 [Fusarium poae]|jgi:3-deoxy-D-arabino-heptulosonate 7-phosphate (DAHP) synthase|uniref:Uncharacterized protein n=1 Tax=Fusarium poae TaxID=36050 RepID=A0A1B8A8Q0_FUSPO|nr:uncharacterized protein FPOAC1_013488 [Fusarium poae]KAG8664708.1 hypothetical protein FPOAC1_013488 [Fusarium poae]OBS16840.1 hypothetical protein FPOA_12581 [Fusarium poae]OBS16849.1 hypothetical protein FPOA_12578 [Fusarium poae]OBS17612.1 hypothetical protein FPOA_11930 [Fusarium poae]
MASITFNKNWVIIEADADVEKINFGFFEADAGSVSSAPTSGKSEKATAHYKQNNPPPQAYIVTTQANFTEDAHVTIRGGGKSSNTIVAQDRVGTMGVWTLVGK